MLCTVEKRFLLLPIHENAQTKTLFLRSADGALLVELTARISDTPNHIMPYDMGAYVGQTLTLDMEPACPFCPTWTDAPSEEGLYAEDLRPVAHFSAKQGWINDPNGLVYVNGTYHMFFQHNPVDTVWGNMHWGHCISNDLVHWTELSEALFPDANGAMFSGSALIDQENRTGLQCTQQEPLLLFYTAAGSHGLLSKGRQSTQRLAYSTDGGQTFHKYAAPLIETITPANRDPKVIFCPEIGKYVLALYLRGREFSLFTSENLLQWQPLQRICIEEDDECPDLYPLTCEGKRYWVLTAAHDRYLIGTFESGHFLPCASTGRLHYGTKSYAAQTFSNAPEGRRIRFAWNQSPTPGMPFTGSMSTPQDMSLRNIRGTVKLCAWPSAEFALLRGTAAEGKDALPLQGRANDVCLTVPEGTVTQLSLFGLTLTLDGQRCLLLRDTTASDPVEFAMPLTVEDGQISLRILQDVHSMEFYAGHGEATGCLPHIADGLLAQIRCKGAHITAWPLASIH